jgi:hypothetical protein
MPMSQSQDLSMPSSKRNIMRRKPPHGTIARYGDRIVEVLGEARGQRVMIRSIHSDGSERLTAVKLTNLRPLGGQLF